jgi:hypothetical protein
VRFRGLMYEHVRGRNVRSSVPTAFCALQQA